MSGNQAVLPFCLGARTDVEPVKDFQGASKNEIRAFLVQDTLVPVRNIGTGIGLLHVVPSEAPRSFVPDVSLAASTSLPQAPDDLVELAYSL